MNLYTTANSPYARVVRVILAETGLSHRVRVQVVPTRVPDCPVNAMNPTGKVPTLETDDGHYLSEARLICQYLDGLHGGPPTVNGDPDVADRAFEGFVAGFVDGLAVWVRELRRPEHERSPGILYQERARAERCLDHLESLPRWRQDRADFLRVSLAVNLLDLGDRLGQTRWKEGRPELARWHEAFCRRPAMRGIATTS